MKYLAMVAAVLLVLSYGCASKPVGDASTLSAADEARLAQEEAQRKKDRDARLVEEDLAKSRQEKEKQERQLQEKMKAAKWSDVNFDYDSYAVRSEDVPRLNELGEWLKANKDIRITVEGHCDERGTIEYNLALGQKRAEAVKGHLVKLGIDGKRIRVISYGKEMPLDSGHTEEAWARNRRAHLAVDKKG